MRWSRAKGDGEQSTGDGEQEHMQMKSSRHREKKWKSIWRGGKARGGGEKSTWSWTSELKQMESRAQQM